MLFLAVGSMWFWAFIVAFVILEFWWIEGHDEGGIGATISFAGFLACLYFFSDISLFSWVASNPELVLGGLGAYFVIGAGWGFAKWFLYLKDRANEYQEKRFKFLVDNGVKNATMQTVVPVELREKWGDRYNSSRHSNAGTHRPLAVDNKGRIITWMTYWPWSALWTAIRDPFRLMYQSLSTRMEQMSKNIFSDVGYDTDADIPEVAEVATREKAG